MPTGSPRAGVRTEPRIHIETADSIPSGRRGELARWLAGQFGLALFTGAAASIFLSEVVLHRAELHALGGLHDLAWGSVVVLAVVLFVYRGYQRRRMSAALRREAREHAAFLESHARLQELSALFQLVVTWNTSMPMADMLNLVTHRIAASLKAQHVSIMLLAEPGDELQTVASYGIESHLARDGRCRVGEGIAGRVAQTREAWLIPRDPAALDPSLEARKGRSITSALSAPILDEDRVLGVVNVNRIQYPEEFDANHLEMLALFARQLGGTMAQMGSAQASRRRESDLEGELERAGDRIKEVDRLRDLFLATAGHEFKTPITVIQGAVELLLQEKRLGEEDPQVYALIREIQGSCRQLTNLVTDVIDLANIESGRVTLHMESTDFNLLTQSALESLRPIAARFGVSLEENYASNLPTIQADRIKLRYPLVQLLAGILRITEAGGQVGIRTLEDGGDVVLEVGSSGPVELTDPERALSLFGQTAFRTSRTVSGMGVGFDLIRVVLELHGGRMTARNAGGTGGLVVEVRLPMASEFVSFVSQAA